MEPKSSQASEGTWNKELEIILIPVPLAPSCLLHSFLWAPAFSASQSHMAVWQLLSLHITVQNTCWGWQAMSESQFLLSRKENVIGLAWAKYPLHLVNNEQQIKAM